jgi:hypothetical protein
MRPTGWLKQKILESQENCCFACRRPVEDVEFDHVIPLSLGGANSLDNWAALCSSCHAVKTKADLKRIAKAKRQRCYHETGRSRSPRASHPLGRNSQTGFNKSLRRHLNGVITPRSPGDAAKE